MKIFIGSSEEHRNIANEISNFLTSRDGIEVLPWWIISDRTHGMVYFYEVLEDLSSGIADAAIFVLAPDDDLETRGKITKTTRDNVLIEIGLFSGKLGRDRTYLCVYKKTNIPSDWRGINYLTIDEEAKWKKKLDEWVGELQKKPSYINKNAILKSRKEIENLYNLEARLGPLDDIANRVKSIEFINLACNIVLTPYAVNPEHEPYTLLGRYLDKLLEGGGNLKITILAPGCPAMFDSSNKIKNLQFFKDPEMAIYESYKTVQKLLNSKKNNPYKKAYYAKLKRFFMYYIDTTLPYGLMEVKFKEKYKHLNHIKVDTYCAFLDEEDKRRSMLIYEHDDSDNYQYFSRKVLDIRNQSIKPEKLEEYLKQLNLSEEKG